MNMSLQMEYAAQSAATILASSIQVNALLAYVMGAGL